MGGDDHAGGQPFQNLVLALGYNTIAIPVAAGLLHPFFGIVLSPTIAAAAMAV